MTSFKSIDRKPVFFGWKVAWAAFVIAAFSWGVGFSSLGVLLQSIHTTRGWPISTISAAITAHFLFSAALVIYLPEAHRRFGVGKTTLAGIALSAVGVVVWANAQHGWQLFLAALISGSGWAATSAAAINAIVAPWFDRDKPKALSIAFNGVTIGGVVFTPLWVGLIAQVGLPVTAIVIASVMVAVLWPLGLKFLGPVPHCPGADRDGPEQPATQKSSLSRRQLLQDWRFVTLSAAFALGLFAQVGLLAHLIARLTPEFGESGAAWAVSLTAICAVVGRTALGWLLGQRNRRLAAAGNFVLQASGVALLAVGSGAINLILGCILFGLGMGNVMSLPPLIAQEEFERADVGTVVALVTAINQAVFAFAPAMLGAFRDLTGGYALSFTIAAFIQVMASLLIVSRLASATGPRTFR